MRRPPDVLVRVTFELHFRGKHLVTDIQDRISAFSAQPFPALLEDNLAAFGKDRLLVFEHVELEIGEVRLSRLEEDLAAGIVKCLRRWAFSARPSSSWPLLPASQDATTGECDDDRLLAGGGWHWPRKQPSSTAPGLNAAIASALAKPGEWPEFLSVLRENYALRRRIADEVSPKLLRRLLAALVQDHGPFIADCAETMIQLHERQPLIPVNIHVFRRALWESVFAELAASSGNQLAQRSFIVKVLRRLTGAHFSTDLVAANLSKALKHQPAKTTIGALLAEATSELQADKARLVTIPLIVVNSKSENASRRVRDLQTFLESGVFGWSLTGRDLEAEMLELLAVAPGDVCILFWDASQGESVRKRLATQFSEKAKSRLLMALAPAAGSWMVCFMQQLRRIHGQKRLFPIPNRQFANDLWELCFEYLAQRKGKSFDPQSFLRHLLRQVANRRKTNYELLLSDLLLRRGPNLQVRNTAGFAPTSLEKALVGLLDQTLFGFHDLVSEIPQSLIDPRFRSLYSDLDVLTHWLRWHKLPNWSHADNPEVTGRRLGSLLSRLPQGIQTYAARGPDRDRTPPAQAGRSEFSFTPSEQIRHWLAFGLWPDSVMAPEASHLSAWLQNQSDADWLKALEGDGPHEAMVARLSRQASSSLFERITRLLAGRTAGLVSGYLRCLDDAGRRIAPVATQLWADQLKKYTLMYLMRASSISGRHAISVVELARSTMLALSLNCRVSYDRLLGGIEQQGHGQEELENICRVLRQELETDRVTPDGDEPVPSSDRAYVRPIPAVILPEPRRPGAELSKPAKASFPGSEAVLAVSTNSPSANIAAFAEFLRTGLFPSSADALALEPSRQWITPDLSGNSQLLLEALQSIAVHPGAVSRLIRYVSPKQLEQIAKTAAPNYAGLLLLYINAGSRLAGASAAAVVPHPESRCAAVHWQQTLAVVLDRHSSKHSAAVILREVTVRVSRQLAMSHARYRSRLLSIAHEHKTENSGYAALADMLEQMLPDSAPAATPAATPPAVETESASAPSSGQKGSRSRTIEAATRASSTDAEGKRNEIVANSDDAAVSSTHDERKSDDDLTIGVPASNDPLAQLDYLLRYGELGENTPLGSSEELMAVVANQLSTRSIVYRRYLLKCAGNEIERKRMARLFPPHLLSRVWPILAPAHHANMAFYKEVLEQALAQSSDSGSSTICREIVVEELLKAISNSQTCRWDAAACLKAAVGRLSCHLSLAPYTFVKRVRAVLENKPANARGEMPAVIERIELEFTKTPPLRATETSQFDRTKPQHPARPSRSVPEGEPFYIANAGLVLLWPFLQTYFQRLDLLEKNTFRDGLSQNRAIYLLQYLTAAKLEAPEHELLLNKILSGWTIQQPLEPPSGLTENEEALSTQLLQGVLKNWEKLKSTSVQGLRSSFLIREGKLLLKDETWSLTVSTKTYDVLLDSLPWSLKMIRLPWMKTLLQVKWR